MGRSTLTDHEKHVLQFIQPDEVVELLQNLIRSRSDYPPGDCRIAVIAVKEKLSEAGIDYQVLSVEKHQPNLIATIGQRDLGPNLLFHAHIDTVPPGEEQAWSHPAFSGEIQAGRIYGRGAGDDKGSVAAQVMALVALARSGVELIGTLQVAIVSDEESGGLVGTKWLHDTGQLTADYLVVGEQTQNHVAIAERVACGIDLTVYGKNAHGAMPWEGENAILKMAGALAYLRKELFPKLAERNSGYLPPPTLSIGKIQGGTQWSIVPDYCKVEIDRRLIPGETREQAMAEIRELLDTYAAEVEPLTYELFSAGEVAENINTSPDEPFVRSAENTLAAIADDGRRTTGYAQTSDGRWFASDGIPIIVFGPGDPALAHAVDEFVTVNELIEATRFYALFGMRWLNRVN